MSDFQRCDGGREQRGQREAKQKDGEIKENRLEESTKERSSDKIRKKRAVKRRGRTPTHTVLKSHGANEMSWVAEGLEPVH